MDTIDLFNMRKIENEYQLLDSYPDNKYGDLYIWPLLGGASGGMNEHYYKSNATHHYQYFVQFRHYRDLFVQKLIKYDL
jgi:hypothetical protein